MKKKVVLAYSGGLDTSVILKWLQLEYDYEVIAACIDVGQKEDYDAVWKKALNSGASKVYIVDVKEAFVKDYLFGGIKSGALYEDSYLLGTAYARPLIAKMLVDIAIKEGAVAIAHGATGKGNDQVRFETGIKALAPELKVIAPWRIWDLKSREDCIDYAEKHAIPLTVTKKDIYSRDENLWHISHEGGNLEDPWNAHDTSIYKWCVSPDSAPDKAETVTITFEKGIPTMVNQKDISPVELIETLNTIGGKHGVGILDLVENRLVGMKSRGVYETPGGTILYEAHKALEKLVLDRQTMAFKKLVGQKYSEMVYDGQWFSPLKTAIDAFIDVTQQNVTGEVQIKLYKGSCTAIASTSPYSLYNEEYVTFGEDAVYNQKDAEGFINLFTLPTKIKAMMELGLEASNPSVVSLFEGEQIKAAVYELEDIAV
ncbi:MAG: argininosuccinate synthase [Firmicutes bacterium]|nr:argininosuccinate synthase [Bacillota bacterium]